MNRVELEISSHIKYVPKYLIFLYNNVTILLFITFTDVTDVTELFSRWIYIHEYSCHEMVVYSRPEYQPHS
jgi:hypothetical protein